MPDVNCIFTMSSLCSSSSGTTDSSFLELAAKRSVKGVVTRKGEVSIRSDELLTSIMLRKEGTDADSSFDVERSGKIVLSSVMFSFGGLYGKFVSVPMIKCAASRCDNAAITCGALNAGFSGTYSSPC